MRAFPVPYLQCYADACLAVPGGLQPVSQSVSQSSRPVCCAAAAAALGADAGAAPGFVPAVSRSTSELFLLAWAWRLRRRLRLGLAILPLWCAISLSLLDSSDGLHERYYRNRGSSSCCEASRDHLNLAKIGGTGFALRAMEPTPKVTLARGLPTEDGSASRPPRPSSVSRED